MDVPTDTPARRALSPAERLDWLRLIRSENVGPITVRQLIARYGTASAALMALPELARRGGRRRPIKVCPADDAVRELALLEEIGGQAIALCEPAYPAALAALEDAPPVLGLLGDADLLGRGAVAMVGARNASANGRRLARQIAADLGQASQVVVSGLARGIDAAAHEGALATGTVAVVAGGLDVIYPEENAALYEAIRDRGAIVSEIPLGTVPQARHFPRRNRLISGLALGTVVVEAAPRSGSLITARFALEQGREVFAVPGSPLDPRARGCNNLIRQGATLVEGAADILDALSGQFGSRIQAHAPPDALAETPAEAAEEDLVAARRAVEELLGPAPVAVDELLRQCQVSPAIVHMALLELELAGRLDRHPGNRVALIAGGSPDR